MEMEEEMEIEPFFDVEEVDIEYEFDAARFFDFTREESLCEAREAESWFNDAQSYPASPFVSKLILMENVNTSPKSKALDIDSDNGDVYHFSSSDVTNRDCEGVVREIFTNLRNGNLHTVLNQPMELTTGFRFNSQMSTAKLKSKAKSSVKPIPRNSTLMKPTASQLAKQNRLPQVAGSRFPTLLAQNERSLFNSSANEGQAAKRQKLEGGNLRKVTDAKQQVELVHKVPKKDGTVDKNPMHAKLKLTIPREPDLVTAHRAQRIRPKTNTEPEYVTTAARRFKACPLNRKIFETPLPLPKKSIPRFPEFQEFHLKTSERAMQHASAVSTVSLHCSDSDKGLGKPSNISASGKGNGESRRPSTAMDASKQDKCGIMHSFRARPLNKKIFSSKGDIGVFRNIKRETTVPMEFNFHTEKRNQHNLPIDLFSKVNL
ncbi:TPX2_importin domain-containing protein, partial [Cephalotus follicularis]